MNTIGVDFDGVIHDYNPKWVLTDVETIGDKATKGALDGLKSLLEQNCIFIYTSRKDLSRVFDWFTEKGFTAKIIDSYKVWDEQGVIGITNYKLPAMAYIDDRAIRFTNWNDIVKYFYWKT